MPIVISEGKDTHSIPINKQYKQCFFLKSNKKNITDCKREQIKRGFYLFP